MSACSRSESTLGSFVSTDGSSVVTPRRPAAKNQSGHDLTPAWSFDGEQLVFATNRPPGSGLKQQPLVVHPGIDGFPDW